MPFRKFPCRDVSAMIRILVVPEHNAVIGASVGLPVCPISIISILIVSCFFVLAISAEPWMHVLCTLGGAWGANKWVQIERDLLADVNELRANKGLPPMVGTHYFFPFVPNVQVDESKKY